MSKAIIKVDKSVSKIINLPGWTPDFSTIFVSIGSSSIIATLEKYDKTKNIAFFKKESDCEDFITSFIPNE